MTPADSEIKGAGAILRSIDGTFIFHERDEHAKIAPNQIAFFAGGREAGETIENTIVRELKEETCLDLKPEQVRLVGYAQHAYDSKYSAVFFIDKVDPTKIDLREGRSVIIFNSLKDFLAEPRAAKLPHTFVSENLQVLENM